MDGLSNTECSLLSTNSMLIVPYHQHVKCQISLLSVFPPLLFTSLSTIRLPTSSGRPLFLLPEVSTLVLSGLRAGRLATDNAQVISSTVLELSLQYPCPVSLIFIGDCIWPNGFDYGPQSPVSEGSKLSMYGNIGLPAL